MRAVSRRVVPVLVLLAGLVVGFVSTPSAAADTAPRHSRLAVPSDFPDPGILHYGSRWYLYATGSPTGVTTTSSVYPDQGYGAVTQALSRRPAWVSQDPNVNPLTWAPDVFVVRSGGADLFVMYYTAVYPALGVHCLGIATSRSPAGGFVDDRTAPFACSSRTDDATGRPYEAIDPSLFLGANGGRYLIYKDDFENAKGFQIVAIPMDDATGTVAKGAPKVLLSPVNRMEAPSAIEHDGRVWLFVSRGDYADCTYKTTVYSGESIRGDFVVEKDLLTSHMTGLCGPGGANVLQYQGMTYIAFHAWRKHDPSTGDRQTYVGTLRWAGNGRPSLY